MTGPVKDDVLVIISQLWEHECGRAFSLGEVGKGKGDD